MFGIASSLVRFGFGSIVIVLALRFFLVFFGIDSEARIVGLIYALSAPFLSYFSGLLGAVTAAGLTIDFDILVAIIVFAIIERLIQRALLWFL